MAHFLVPHRYRSTFHRHLTGVDGAQCTKDCFNHAEENMPYEQPGTIAAIPLVKVTGTDGVIIISAGF